ncbi:MAG: outer membrane protein assembly factor BamD [Saprospiraceae bacterium]|jgi:outer membrane protein assembly factor BamD
MKSKLLLFLLCGTVLMTLACKSEFEKLRASGDPDTLYKKAFDFYEAEEYLKSQTLFELVINNLRGKVEAEKVYFYYAYTHYKLNKFVLASYYFKNFTNTFPNSEYREESDFMSAYANYQLSPTYRLDQTYTFKAIEEFQLFANTYPDSERVDQCNTLIDGMRKKLEVKAYSEAELYFDLQQYQSATHSFENMLKDFPDTKQAENIRYMIVKASYDLAVNSIFEKQQERHKNVIKNAELFLNRYSRSDYTKEVKSIKKNSSDKIKELS